MKRLFLLILICLSAFSRASAETVKIGVILPLTGNQAVYGIDAQRAVDLLAPDGVLQRGNYNFKFILEDGQCGVGNSAVTAAHKLINVDRAKFLVVGCSGEILQAGPLAERAKVIAIGFASSHPEVSTLGDYVFRTYVDIRKAVALISDLMLKENSGRVAVITEESSFTLGIKKELLDNLGSRLAVAEDFHVDEVSFNTLLARVRTKKPSAYYLNTASPRTYLNLFKQMRELGINEPVYSYHAPADLSVLEALGERQDGVKFVATPEVDQGSPEFESFLKEYNAKYPEGAHIDALLRTSYDAIMAIMHGVEEVGPDSTKVKDFLYRVEMPGAVGMLSFEANGDVKDLNFALKQIVKGKPERLS